MNKNRLGEEHPVKISKNNSLTSRAGFCLPSASQRSPGKPGGLGQLQRWEETSAKPAGSTKPPRCRPHPAVIHTETRGDTDFPVLSPVIPIHPAGARMEGGDGRKAQVGKEMELR